MLVFRITILTLALLTALATLEANGDEQCLGPPNLLKTMKTPFSGSVIARYMSGDQTESLLAPISITPPSRPSALKRRLVPATLYLPERVTIGKPARFTIKGPPGSKVALAMADRNKGASPILGNPIRLGPDRKVVAIDEIPDGGVLEVYIGTPLEGDLIGEHLFFEAAVWSKNDMSDTQIAKTISPAGPKEPDNAVRVAGQIVKKKGIRLVPDSAVPLSQRQGQASLSSGQP